jgi:predicted HicB family RNase H-like nuclease
MSTPKPSVDLGYPTEAHGRIPAFQNIEEEAAFWDAHSISDFMEASEPVEVQVSKNLSDPLTVRLDPEDRAEIARRAKAKGVGPSTLVRMWVKDQLKQEA